MCVNESISYSCGHSTPKVIRRCPLSTQWPDIPPCTIPADRPLHVSEMCQGCVRVAWVKEVIRKEAHHRNFHEKNMCKCNEVHTEKERRRAREGAVERKKAKRMGSQLVATQPDKSIMEIAPQQSAENAWRVASCNSVPRQSTTGCWDGVSYGTVPQQQRWENFTKEIYPQADRQWENVAAENYRQPNGELRNCEQQEELTYVGYCHESFNSGGIVQSVEQGLAIPASNNGELGMSVISDRHAVVDDWEDVGDFDQRTAVSGQIETQDLAQSTVVNDQRGKRDSNQCVIVGNQVSIRLVEGRDSSPSPPVADGSVMSSRQSFPTYSAVQRIATDVNIQHDLLKLSVDDALGNVERFPVNPVRSVFCAQ